MGLRKYFCVENEGVGEDICEFFYQNSSKNQEIYFDDEEYVPQISPAPRLTMRLSEIHNKKATNHIYFCERPLSTFVSEKIDSENFLENSSILKLRHRSKNNINFLKKYLSLKSNLESPHWKQKYKNNKKTKKL
ncbi:hypothetical protein ACKWTF_000882 [Chironomus riparius]